MEENRKGGGKKEEEEIQSILFISVTHESRENTNRTKDMESFSPTNHP